MHGDRAATARQVNIFDAIKEMLYDDNINWSGQRRARELKARVKILKQRRRAGKPIPISKAAQQDILDKHKQF